MLGWTINVTIYLALFTETWLKESIPDQSIKITGYQLFRRDRKNGSHGGVCAFIKDSIECKTLLDLHDDYEILWLLLRPKRLSRGFSDIVVAVIYHPPTADNTDNSAVILAGDFNRLDFRIPAKCFQLKPTVNFPTRVRDRRQSKVASIGRYVINIPWEDLLSSDQTVDEKLELFTELIHYGLDTIMP